MTLGLRVARDLERAGDRALFVIDTSMVSLFRGSEIEHRPVSVNLHEGEAFTRTIDEALRETRASSIVLADAFMTGVTLERLGLGPDVLLRRGLPVVAIDTWCVRESGVAQDTLSAETEVPRWIETLPDRLVPVPFARPVAERGFCALLPEPLGPGERAGLGLEPDDKAIVLTTSPWQHASIENDPRAAALAASVLSRLSSCVAALGPRVRVLHVGPGPLALLRDALGSARYRHVAPLAATHYAKLIASAELLLSLNASATTISAAIASSIPVALVTSSRSGPPIEPFWLWPIGLRRFLDPVLRENPYLDALASIEVLDAPTLEATLRGLLFDRAKRDELRARQADYVARVKRLPSPSSFIRSVLEGTR